MPRKPSDCAECGWEGCCIRGLLQAVPYRDLLLLLMLYLLLLTSAGAERRLLSRQKSPAVHGLSQSDHRQSTTSANQITGSPRHQPIRSPAVHGISQSDHRQSTTSANQASSA